MEELRMFEHEENTYILDGNKMWIYKNGEINESKFIPSLEELDKYGKVFKKKGE